MNTLITPGSGNISFSNFVAAGSNYLPPLSASARIAYTRDGGLTIVSTASSSERFNVEGNFGSLLTVNDSATGRLFNVNDISGFPLFFVTDNGTVSSTGVVHALGGNSNQWNSNYTTTNLNSASWSSVYNSYNSISSRYTTLDYLSSNFIRLGGLYAGPNPGSITDTTPVSAVSGMYVEPVSGYAGFYTNAPVAPVDIRGSTKIIGFSAFGNTPTCLRMRDDYLYVLCQGNNTLNVFDTSTSVPQFVASAATYALGSYSTLAIQGNYAYVTTTAGIQSFNVSATTPVSAGIVGTQSYLGTNYTLPSQIVTQGKYAYATYTSPSFGNSSVYNVVDISDPTKLSHAISTPSNILGGNANLAIQGNNLYHGFNFIVGNGLYQFNLAAKPVPQSGDAIQIQQSTISTPISIAAHGRYVYYSGARAFFVIDTTRSGLNRIVATLTLDNMVGITHFDMVIQRQYAYVLRASGIYVINISNPRNPVIVQRITISLSTSTYRGMVIRGRYLYFTDGTASAIYRMDLGGSYVQQLEAGGIHTEHLYSSNVYAANEVAAIGGGSFGGGLNVQGAANVQGSLSITPASGTQTFSNYFSVVSSNPATTSTVFAVTNTNKVGIGTDAPDEKLHVLKASAGTVTADPNSIAVFEGGGNAHISILTPDGQTGGVVFGSPTDNFGSYLTWNYDNNALKLGTAKTGGFIQLLTDEEAEAIRITSTGNVGIHTIVPAEKLTVSGNVSATGVIYSSGGNSNQWNAAYTNLVTNSANYLSGASTSYVNANFVKLSGDTMTGPLSTPKIILTTGGSSSNPAIILSGTNFNSGIYLTGDGDGISINTRNNYTNLSITSQGVFSDRVIGTTADGSAAFPSVYVGYETNSGLFRPAANNIAISIAGTERIRVNSNGLTVTGNISANGTITASGGNSTQWNAAYTNLVSNSSAYLSGANLSSIATASGAWNSNYTSFNANSSFYDAAVNELFTYVITESGDEFITEDSLLMVDSNIDGYPAWNSTTDTVISLSAGWQNTGNIVANNASNWTSTNTSVCANSANWSSAYTTTNTNSANWSSAYTTLCSTSAFRISNTITSVLFPNGYIFSSSDTGKTYHVDTRSTPVSVLLPSNIPNDFSVTLVTLGTNNMHVSSSQVPMLCATGTRVNLAFTSTFIYKYDNLFWGLGSLI
jgi:hypothetical protein